MSQWSLSVQKMIEWIERNIENSPTLPEMSREIGYSPYYCSYLFHHVCGLTLKSYMAGRRLCRTAMALRDTNERIIDIALRCGFSSQEGFEVCEFPASTYLVFFHPAFDYLSENGEAMGKVEVSHGIIIQLKAAANGGSPANMSGTRRSARPISAISPRFWDMKC